MRGFGVGNASCELSFAWFCIRVFAEAGWWGSFEALTSHPAETAAAGFLRV